MRGSAKESEMPVSNARLSMLMILPRRSAAPQHVGDKASLYFSFHQTKCDYVGLGVVWVSIFPQNRPEIATLPYWNAGAA